MDIVAVWPGAGHGVKVADAVIWTGSKEPALVPGSCSITALHLYTDVCEVVITCRRRWFSPGTPVSPPFISRSNAE